MPAHLCEACGGLPKEHPGFLGTRVPSLSALVAPQRVGAHELLSTGWTKSTFNARFLDKGTPLFATSRQYSVSQHGARGGRSPPELSRRVLNTRDQHSPSTKRSALSAHLPQRTRCPQRSSSTKQNLSARLPQNARRPPSAIQTLKICELTLHAAHTYFRFSEHSGACTHQSSSMGS